MICFKMPMTVSIATPYSVAFSKVSPCKPTAVDTIIINLKVFIKLFFSYLLQYC